MESKNKRGNKILTFFTCIVLIFVSVLLYMQPTYGIGYKYYKDNTIQIGETQQDNKFNLVLNDYLKEVEENGYYVCSVEMDKDISSKLSIVRKSKLNDEELNQIIKENIIISIFATKLTIDEDIYYFKTEEECNKFVNDLKQYTKVNVKIDSDIIELNRITNDKVLQEKIEKSKRIIDNKKKNKISSRADVKRTVVSRKCPLDNYSYISSGYGQRWGRMHTGIDYAAAAGTPVHPWKPGKVSFAAHSGGYGNYIKVQHNDGMVSCYAHLSKIYCSVGDYVNCNSVIGLVGSTGRSTGSHLHFEIKVNNSFVNPMNYL